MSVATHTYNQEYHFTKITHNFEKLCMEYCFIGTYWWWIKTGLGNGLMSNRRLVWSPPSHCLNHRWPKSVFLNTSPDFNGLNCTMWLQWTCQKAWTDFGDKHTDYFTHNFEKLCVEYCLIGTYWWWIKTGLGNGLMSNRRLVWSPPSHCLNHRWPKSVF